MNKHGFDTKVKKTLVRNYEHRAKPAARKQTAVLDMGCSNSPETSSRSSQKENLLSQPSLCSSEALAHYLSDVKKSLPLMTLEDVDKCQLGSKVSRLECCFNCLVYSQNFM